MGMGKFAVCVCAHGGQGGISEKVAFGHRLEGSEPYRNLVEEGTTCAKALKQSALDISRNS